MDSYKELAGEIVCQAIVDYEKNLGKIKKLTKRIKDSKESKIKILNEYRNAREMVDDCEKFFHGDWIKSLTDINPIIIMEKVQALVDRGEVTNVRSMGTEERKGKEKSADIEESDEWFMELNSA